MASPGEYNALQSKTGRAGPYLVKLLLPEVRLPDRGALLTDLRAALGRVDEMNEQGGSTLGFAYPEHTSEFKEGAVPSAHFLSLVEGLRDEGDLELALAQTWDWEEAEDAVEQTRAVLFFNDMMASGLSPTVRFDLFARALQVVARHVSPLAIHWLPSQRLVNPARFLAESPPDPTQSAINVRLFNVQGKPGETLMDTLGMAAFGLPDLQCHFVGLDPGRVASCLYGYAEYLFQNGRVIESGHTVQGLTPGSKWTVRSEVALVEPDREVFDLDPGAGKNAR